jgi:5'-deoxynucleotidase YfbR-like HD superfamily hydrolase
MGEIVGRAWQRMLSGRRLDILDPSPLDLEIGDIALGLSRLSRWNGQTHGDHGYSVAQHSIFVAELVAVEAPTAPVHCVLAALLHDGPEYVTSDLVTPFKKAVGKSYRELEARMARAIHTAFGLPAVLPSDWQAAIDRADRLAAFIEAVHLAGFSEVEARQVFGVRRAAPEVNLKAWPALVARNQFLAIYEDLVSGGAACVLRWRASGTCGTARRAMG